MNNCQIVATWIFLRLIMLYVLLRTQRILFPLSQWLICLLMLALTPSITSSCHSSSLANWSISSNSRWSLTNHGNPFNLLFFELIFSIKYSTYSLCYFSGFCIVWSTSSAIHSMNSTLCCLCEVTICVTQSWWYLNVALTSFSVNLYYYTGFIIRFGSHCSYVGHSWRT